MSLAESSSLRDLMNVLTSSGKHVVFGEVVEGMEIVKQLEKLGSREGRVSTSRKSVVKDCGIVPIANTEAAA